MKKIKKNEELQSRREFFKKAAKGALPIVAGVLLSSIPEVAKAMQNNGCNYYCQNSCKGTCTGTCNTMCGKNCTQACRGGCENNSK